jgi:hypothetical protein
MNKREFLRALAVGAGAGMAAPLHAFADRVRILPAMPAVDDAVAVGAVSPEFQRFAAAASVGEARAHGALRVFWLRAGTTAPSLNIATLEEARARGDLLVSERAQASVPALLVENRGKSHALLMAGEILLGGKQNRVIIEDVLMPPLSGPRDLAVYCVEQGRWAGRSAAFESSGSFAAPQLRARVMERADQARVWAEVGRYATKAGAASPTSSYQAIYDKPEVKQHQEDATRALAATAPTGTHGAAVFAADALLGLDVFQDATLFTRQWPKLLRAYALEILHVQAPAAGDEARLRGQLEDLLRRAAKTPGALRGSAGVGRLFEFRLDRFRGAALVAEAQVVHATLL